MSKLVLALEDVPYPWVAQPILGYGTSLRHRCSLLLGKARPALPFQKVWGLITSTCLPRAAWKLSSWLLVRLKHWQRYGTCLWAFGILQRCSKCRSPHIASMPGVWVTQGQWCSQGSWEGPGGHALVVSMVGFGSELLAQQSLLFPPPFQPSPLPYGYLSETGETWVSDVPVMCTSWPAHQTRVLRPQEPEARAVTNTSHGISAWRRASGRTCLTAGLQYLPTVGSSLRSSLPISNQCCPPDSKPVRLNKTRAPTLHI